MLLLRIFYENLLSLRFNELIRTQTICGSFMIVIVHTNIIRGRQSDSDDHK